jgi:hypothetical protein
MSFELCFQFGRTSGSSVTNSMIGGPLVVALVSFGEKVARIGQDCGEIKGERMTKKYIHELRDWPVLS